MRILGYIFLALLLSTGITIADYFLPGSFLLRFIDNSFIETFAVLVGLNLSAIVFLLGQLVCFEEKLNTAKNFDNTRREIKHNALFLFISFSISLVLLIIRPDLTSNTVFVYNMFFYIMNGLILSVFILAIFTIYEILQAVFSLGKKHV